MVPVAKEYHNLLVVCHPAVLCAALLLPGANPNLCDFDGASPLHLAVELQDEECLAGAAPG